MHRLARSALLATPTRRTVQIVRPLKTFSTSSRTFATRHYTKEHEWISVNNGVGTVGISNYAQKALGDVVFVDLPEVGKELAQKETAVSVESVKVRR